MSMNTYPLEAPLAFIIDEVTAAWINLAAAKADGRVSPDIQKLIDEGRFDRLDDPEVKVILDREDFLNVSDAKEYLEDERNISTVYCSEFDGGVSYLGEDGEHSIRTVGYSDDYIAYIAAQESVSPFHQAYENIGGFIAEVKETFRGENIFPDGFDYLAHVVSISGAYFA